MTLYHLVAWLGLCVVGGAPLAFLLAVHAAPAALCTALWPETEDTSIFGAPFYVMAKAAGRVPTDQPPHRFRRAAKGRLHGRFAA